ncbi:MAG TPA: hypothetical protein VJV79_04015 [Polyangiaceae bacterium]|nr:hypothetical protein [Polyangiaceae bacterium]
MNVRHLRVVLKLSAGASSQLERAFVWGTPAVPFSLGAQGDWPIVAPGVGETHLFLGFDGHRLLAAAASPAHSVAVQGLPIGTDWTEVPVPSRLVFGAAGIAVECEEGGVAEAPIRPRPIVALSRPEQLPTQVFDLSQTLQLRTVRLDIPESMLAELRGAPPPEPQPELPRPAPTTTRAFQLPTHLARASAPVELANTLYDGGALRELAAQLAVVDERVDTQVAAQSVPAPLEVGGALRRRLATFRESSLPKQLTIALLPLAMVGIWAMPDSPASAAAQVRSATKSIAQSNAPSAAPAPGAPGAPGAPSASLPTGPEIPGLPSDPRERQALIAASSGNKADAAALYEHLASARNSRTFAIAARLTREDRVRKP